MKKSLLDQFVEHGEKLEFDFNLSKFSSFKYQPLTNDALFHLPLISICVLVIAKGLDTLALAGNMGRLVGLLIEETIPGFKGSSQLLGWSVTLRHRTAEAISFLEQIALIEVDQEHKIKITKSGADFLLKLRKEETELGVKLRDLIRRTPDLKKKSERFI